VVTTAVEREAVFALIALVIIVAVTAFGAPARGFSIQ
jgi:hypothetical protein